jgi:hypothetical protein
MLTEQERKNQIVFLGSQEKPTKCIVRSRDNSWTGYCQTFHDTKCRPICCQVFNDYDKMPDGLKVGKDLIVVVYNIDSISIVAA